MTMGEESENNLNEEEDTIDIAVPFAALHCPECDVPREPGACPDCGTEVPAPEVDKHAEARGKAFLPLTEQLKEIRQRFDQIGDGDIPLTPDQFLQAINETDIYDQVAEMPRIGRELTGLDLASQEVVGGKARSIIAGHIGRIENLLASCEEIGRFQVEPPADELRALAIETGRYGANLASALIGAVAAQSFDEARVQAAKAQELLNGPFPFGDSIDQALEKIEPVAAPDLNRRLALALGKGDFLDEDANLDVGRILIGFSEEEEPLVDIAERVEASFAHLLGGGTSSDGSSLILLPSAVLVAASERPLRTHSAARWLKENLERAALADKTATSALVNQVTAQGALIYTALSRVERATEKLGDDSEAEHAVDQVMVAYRNIAETAFRTIGWLSVNLDLILEGQQIPMADHPPMLGELCQRLTSGSELSRLLAESIDPGLRNAEAHSQYQWVASRQVVKDLRTKQEWSVDEIDEALKALTACLAGADAGYGCFVVGEGLSGQVPDWLREDATPIALEMLATLCFAPYGHEIGSVEDQGGTVVLRKVESRDPARLIPPLGGMAAIVDPATFTVRTADGEVIAEIDGTAIRAAVKAKPAFKDLAVLRLAHESSRNQSQDPQQVDDEFAAFAVKVIAVSGLRSLTAGDFGPEVLHDLRDRVQWSSEFLKGLSTNQVDSRMLLKSLSRIRDSLTKASRSATGSVESLATRLTNLAKSAEDTGFSWPPKVSGV